MKLLIKRIRERHGFSLSETLVAILIILLVGSVIAAGMPAAEKAYFKVIESANAQMLLSTMLTEFRNEFSTAADIKTRSDHSVEKYINPITGTSSIYFITDKDTGKLSIWIKTYDELQALAEEGTTVGKERPFVSNATKTDSLYMDEMPSILYSDGIVTVSNIKIKSSKTDSVVAALDAPYKIRVLVP